MPNPKFMGRDVLICRVGDGFYPITADPDYEANSLVKQARDNGVLNKHIDQIEDIEGNVLWKRTDEN
jgi:hypothetical protein